jgi:hypothetical protein
MGAGCLAASVVMSWLPSRDYWWPGAFTISVRPRFIIRTSAWRDGRPRRSSVSTSPPRLAFKSVAKTIDGADEHKTANAFTSL